MVKKYKLKANIAGFNSGEVVDWREDVQVSVPIKTLLELGLVEEVDQYQEFVKDVADVARKHGVTVNDSFPSPAFHIKGILHGNRVFIYDIADELKKGSK